MTDSVVLLDLEQFTSLADAVAAIDPERRYEDIAARTLEECGGSLTHLVIFFMSAVTRARCLQEGVAQAARVANPQAAFPLIRQFAETVAVVSYVLDQPEYVAAVMEHPRDRPKGVKRKSIQALVNYMDSNHSHQFGAVYADLCEITHYGSFAWATPFRASTEGPSGSINLNWHSGPRWKDERQGLVACALTLELADAMHQALAALGQRCIQQVRALQSDESSP